MYLARGIENAFLNKMRKRKNWSLRTFLIGMCLVAQSFPTLCNPMDCSPPGSSVHEDSPGKNTGACSLSLLQGIFPTQELNRGFLHCRWILFQLSHQGSPGYAKYHLKLLFLSLSLFVFYFSLSLHLSPISLNT